MTHVRPSSRSLIGMLLLTFGLAAYAFLAAALGEVISEWPLGIVSVYYLVAGVVWIYPAIKILRWMAAAYNEADTDTPEK
ncbi:MAG: DUF2842 domain-containing protein [Kordiimonadaceae bacterium]|nr:DUF2842 domain-containing protein [Kordiimonadaceae bacterium]